MVPTAAPLHSRRPASLGHATTATRSGSPSPPGAAARGGPAFRHAALRSQPAPPSGAAHRSAR
jgi:hypothetical protein